MKNRKPLLKAIRVFIAFIVVMALWYLWDSYVVEDTLWKYLVLAVVAAAIYGIEIAIAGKPKA